MPLFYQPALHPGDTTGRLTDDDARHALKTLRMQPGAPFTVTDGRGTRYDATLLDGKTATFQITKITTFPANPYSIRIAVAPTKNLDRIEWFVEKAVELGVDRISFFFGQHSERRALKLDRIEKIAVAAMKQSLQYWLPVLDDAVPFERLLRSLDDEHRYVAHLPADGPTPDHLLRSAPANGRYVVLIGPEGDFSPAELAGAMSAGFQHVALGPTRLRTETAALAAVHTLHLVNA